MNQTKIDDPHDLELLAGSVLGDLSEEETEHLESLLAHHDSSSDILLELETTAAGVQLALMESNREPMPDSVADRIRVEGRRMLETRASERRTAERGVKAAVATSLSPSETVSVRREGSGVNGREWIAWLCAAAALLLAVGLWRSERGPETITASQARVELLSRSDSLIRVDWTAGKTPFDQPVIGDVVWDSKSQKGFMRFENMPINDPLVEQYQLWIIDPARDDEPIDGGVFDIAASGEVVVEIDAKLNVVDPAAFAITIEKPGGVVVSTQDRLPLLAAVQSS